MSGRNNLSGADLLKWKRDREKAAAAALEAVIDAASSTPDEYFHGNVAKDNTTYLPVTKVLIAATAYIADLEANQAPSQARAQAAATGSAARSNDPDIASLRQAATRLIAKAEDKAVAARVAGAGEIDAETREVLKKGSDMIADLIDMIDQGGMSQQQKRAWAREQESWGRRFNLQ